MRSPWDGGWLVTRNRTSASAAIQRLMRDSGRNLQPLAGPQNVLDTIGFYGQFPRQHVEKLPRLRMFVLPLRSPRRHALFNDRQRIRLHQMPAIAAITPRCNAARYR